MIRAAGISMAFGRIVALDDVHLDVRRGEILALVGENGSGKSTLVRILAGLLRPDRGSIAVAGEETSLRDPRMALDAGIALVSQEITALRDMSIAENVLLTKLRRRRAWVNRQEYAAQARPFLEEVGIAADPLAPFSTLAAGERELAEIAKALAASPRLLILDEATSRLGPSGVARVFTILRRLRDCGVSTIFITHRLGEIVEVADRAVVLRDGKRVGELDRGALTPERLTTMMVGRPGGHFRRSAAPLSNEPALQLEALVADGASSPISAVVHRGEVVAVAGLVGSGRTELLESIAGVRRSEAGAVVANGRRLVPGSVHAAIDAGVLLVPEDRHRQGLVLHGSIRENIVLGMHRPLSRASREADARVAMKAVRRLAIRTASVDLGVTALSGGNQQKVVLARALLGNPRVLLLDEPTRGVDVGAREELFRIVDLLAASGVAVVLASSDLTEVLSLADRILILHERRLAGELARADATEERIAYLSTGGTLAAAA